MNNADKNFSRNTVGGSWFGQRFASNDTYKIAIIKGIQFCNYVMCPVSVRIQEYTTM